MPSESPSIAPHAYCIGFDFGTKRIGVAVGQGLTKTATPLPTLQAKEGTPDWQLIAQMIAEWKPAALVVGLPLNMDGTEQPITQLARRFANRLRGRFNLPVFEIDERLTTVESRARVFEQGGYKALKKEQIDSVAAVLILEAFFEKDNRESAS